MFLYFLGVSAGVLQALTLGYMLDSASLPVGVAWLWYVASAAFLAWTVYLWVRFVVWLLLRSLFRDLWGNFQRWGVGWEAAGKMDLFFLVFSALWCCSTSYLTIREVAPALGVARLDAAYFGIGLVWLLSLWLPLFWVLSEFLGLKSKANGLHGLSVVVRNRFPVSELVSLYDCLHAPAVPRIFWEEYRRLSSVQVTEATNQRYRERAAPYLLQDTVRSQRLALSVAVLAVFLAVLVALPTVFDVITRGVSLLDWLCGVFGFSAG